MNSFESAGVTQLVECDLAKVDVAGSNPVSRSSLWQLRHRFGLARTELPMCSVMPYFSPLVSRVFNSR
jgi:hypothetical protein